MDIAGHLPIAFPQALLLGIALTWLYARRLRRRNLWRALALAMAVILLCYPVLKRSSRAVDIVIVADRSRSISEEGLAKQTEIVDLAAGALQQGDRLGIVSFNERAHVEQVLDTGPPVGRFDIPYSPDASDLAEGLRTAIGLTQPHRAARILVLSDGEYTGATPQREALAAAQRRVPVYYRNLKRAQVLNLAATDVSLPDKVMAGEPFRVVFRVNATQATDGRYRLLRNDRIVGPEQDGGWKPYRFRSGDNEIVFTTLARDAGIQSYRLEVESIPPEDEALRKDNTAGRYVKVLGERPMLLVNNTGAPDNVSGILAAGGMRTHIVAIGNYRMDLRALTGYKGVILNNVPILGLTRGQIDALRRFVEQEAGGLMVTGGNRSYAMGGYYKTAVADILPVSLEDRRQSKKISTAFSIVLDRSGSMSMTTPSGDTKMALANEAVVECIRLMTPVDSVSVVAVDSQAHIMLAQQPVGDSAALISQVRRIVSQGGGIFVYNGLVAAGKQILNAPQTNRHILLFADAADSEQPDDYRNLLAKFAAANVTVSVVGLGSETDPDAAFLKDIAARGKGSVYFTQDAAQLVQFFTADTITYTRNSYIEEPAPVRIMPAAATIAPGHQWADFTCGGYNLTFPRPDAAVAMRTADEDKAPALAFWQRGLGRVAALAHDAEGPFTLTRNYGDIMLGAARWVMGSDVQDSFQTRVDYEGNRARVRLQVSEEQRARAGLARLTVFTPSGKTIERPLRWEAGNELAAGIELRETGMYRGVVQIGEETLRIGPMSMPVSAEFRKRRDPNAGRRNLAELAARTGGAEVLDIRDLFERRSRSEIVRPLTTPFLIVLLLAILLDIAEARFAMLDWARRRIRARFRAPTAAEAPQHRRAPSKRRLRPRRRTDAPPPAESATPAEGDKPPEEEPPGAPEAETQEGMEYLGRSKRAAQARLKSRRPAHPGEK